MAALTGSSAVQLQIEGLNDIIPLVIERDNTLDSVLGDGGRSYQVSTKAFRIRMQVQMPGAWQQVNLDAASAFPIGIGAGWDQGTITPVSYMVPVAYSKLADLTGSPSSISTYNPVVKTIQDVADEIKTKRDIALQTAGDGALATVVSVSGSTITLSSPTSAAPTGGFGSRLLRKGQAVQIMTSAYALRGTGPCNITNVANILGSAQSITVDAVPASTANTDLVIVAGVATGTPLFINGLPVFHSTSTAGTIMGIARTNTYVVANGVNLNGAQVSAPAFRTALNQIRNRLGSNALKSQFFHTHFSQVQAYEELGYNLQLYPLNNGTADKFDLMFSGKKTIDGRPIHENVHADQTRWDIILKEAYLKVKWGSGTFWYKNRDGQMVFNQYDTTSGAPTPIELMFMVDAWQLGCQNLVALGSLTNCKVPALN